MAAWNNSEATVTRQEAITKINTMATEKGYRGTFKVLYDGNVVANPSDLPEQVVMSKVQISAVLDQA